MNYFAYASNLNRKQMLERCPNAKPKFIAILPNYKLIFAGWSRKWHGGVASIKPSRGEKVTGAVYEVSDKDITLLDSYEDYPHTYNRINVVVFTEQDEPVRVTTYIRVKQAEETKPSPEYVATIQQGDKDWDID